MSDERISAILDLIYRLASGELDARIAPSDRNDDIDAIIVGLNMLGEELAAAWQEIRETQREIAQLAAGVSHLETGMFIIDAQLPNNPIVYVNPSFASLTGFHEDPLGRPFFIEDNAEVMQAIDGAIEQRRRYRSQLKRQDRWLDLLLNPVFHEGQVISWIGLVSDITERKRVEVELRQAKEEAERANHAKSEFLSRMSHELRTPLNAILGFAQVLEIGTLAPEDRDSVEHILKGGRHLLALINEVLDITRIEAGRLALSIEPVPVDDLAQECLDLVRPLARQRTLHLGIEEGAACERHVLADRRHLKQVLVNLLANAVKYNRERGSVAIGCEARGKDQLRILVRDTGQGILPEQRSKLFEPFERLGAERMGVEGSGLGLTLAKRLMEAMGGSIGVESVVDVGSTFWVELPLVESPVDRTERMHAPLELPGAEPRPPVSTVLYIEDDLSNLRLVERILGGQARITLLAAMQGRLGLELAREYHPDLILLDMHLPDLTGDEVLRRLQEDAATRDIPVVMISADATPRQIKRLLAAGARAYLTKPLDVRQFLDTVNEVIPGRIRDR